MSKKIERNLGIKLSAEGKGPWDPAGNTGENAGDNPPKTGRGKSSASGSDEPAGSKPEPNNPWNQPNDDSAKPQRSMGSGLEDMLRRAGRSGGGGPNGGWGSMGRRPNGKPIWPILLGVLGFVWVISTSIYQLDPGEEGVITRFGKYSRTVGSGVSFILPAPLEHMTKVDTQQLRYTMVGSPKSSAENLVLTKDQNLIDLAFQIAWNVRDPERFLFQLEEAEDGNRDDTVKAVAESAMREIIANYDYDTAVGPGRLNVEGGVRERMQKILDGYGSGIRIQSVAIKQSDPPEQTKEAFNRVAAAKQKRESNLSDARAYASQVTQRAEGDTGEFDRIYVQYREAPEVTKRRLYYQTMEAILGKMDKTIVESGNVQPYLALPELKKRAAAAVAEADKAKTGKEPVQ